ncbi:MAG: hypothetical protein J7L46_03645 [Bacteroidales bacterium]|nr:hypothetical protein [Bacteroidales bacterium]
MRVGVFFIYYFLFVGWSFSQDTIPANDTTNIPAVDTTNQNVRNPRNTFGDVYSSNDTNHIAPNVIQSSPKSSQNGIEFYFKKNTATFNKNEIISNVLVIRNLKSQSLKFYVDVSIPDDWKVFNKKRKLYELNGNDSIFIPFHIIPKVNFKGSTRFLFTAYLSGEHQEAFGFTYFLGVIKKHISWRLSTSDNKIYLMNGQTQKPFNVSLFNSGFDEQDIHLSVNSLSSRVVIMDSLGTTQAKLPVTFTLKSQQDSSFYYVFSAEKEKRNAYLIDMDGYNPFSLGERKKYSVFINSTSPNPSDNERFRAGNKINFIKLSDEWEVNKYGSDVIPLMVDMNAYNILGDNPMMNVMLRGQTYFGDQSFLVYNSQLTYFSNVFSTNPYQNANYYLGYFHNKFDVQFGNINGGILGTIQSGEGLKANYYINDKQRVGAFYTRTPRLFSSGSNFSTVGVTHDFRNSLFRVNTKIGHTTNLIANKIADVANINASTTYFKNHSFGLRLGLSRSVLQDSSSIKFGYYTGLFYSGKFLQQKLYTHLSSIYFSPDFGIYGLERLSVNLGNEYHLNEKWHIGLQNNFYRNPEILSGQLTGSYFYQLNNQLNFSRMDSKIGSMNPFAFYNFSRIQNFNVQSRGLGFNIGKYDFKKHYHYFVNIRSGYNYSPDTLQENFFFFRFAGLLQYRTFTFMTRYTLGNLSMNKNMYAYNSYKNPQTIGLTFRHQYTFPFPSLVMRNAVNYLYSSLSGNNLNYTPELYFFTKSGWRFRIFAEWNFYRGSNNTISDAYYSFGMDDDAYQPHWTQDLYLGVGIRKEFGIPIPKTKKKYCTTKFVAFYDLNGDGKRNSNEDLLENVVLQVENWEVITNKNGEAQLKNVPTGVYLFNAFSIPDLKGWFPHTNDTLALMTSGKVFVPFTRGVKVTGRVFMEMDKYNINSGKPMDLSHIKISMVNDRTFTTLTGKDGSFEIYVPLGKYVLTMDEKVLGSRYHLLKNNFDLFIDDQFDNIFIPFYIVEKPRKVKIIKFDSNGNRIDE